MSTVDRHDRNVDAVASAMQRRQNEFLEHFAKHGTIRKACSLVPVNRETVRIWNRDDIFGFAERFKAAHNDWVDSQEELLYAYNEGIKPGQTPIGILAALTANRPEKWNRATKLQLDVPNEMIQQLAQLQALDTVKRQQGQLPESATVTDTVTEIEGKSKLLPWTEE